MEHSDAETRRTRIREELSASVGTIEEVRRLVLAVNQRDRSDYSRMNLPQRAEFLLWYVGEVGRANRLLGLNNGNTPNPSDVDRIEQSLIQGDDPVEAAFQIYGSPNGKEVR